MKIVRLFSASALFFLFIIVSATAFAQQKELSPALLPNIDQNWLRQVQQNIECSEYFIRWQENCSAYQSPNRSQNLRFTYYETGFKAQPRTDGDEWQAEFRLKTVSRGEASLPIEKMTFVTKENTLTATSSALDIHYCNDGKGMRQDFIIKEKPEGTQNLRLNFSASLDNVSLTVNADGIVVRSKGKSASSVMRYADLKVWDATGKGLKARMEKTADAAFAIVVEDKNAVYPVTVDPLSTSPNWTAESNQNTAYLGWSVATAGDVNGDGYSDIIVGAPLYDNGENNEGRAYVYHGSASGLLSATPNWTAESNINGAEFGISVGTAGDVNGDNYSDVIVGAYGANSAYVYHGSGTGVNSSPTTTLTGSTGFGWSVGTAGNVNGDNYSDVIVGTSSGNSVYVYHGSGTGVNSSPTTTLTGSSGFGYSVGTAGDVNGDSYTDVIIGANTGSAAYVYYGSGSGVSASGSTSLSGGSGFGNAVGTAGDVNGDGYSDVIVGASGSNSAYVYHGSGSGLNTSAAISLSGGSNFGYSVGTAGDVNGDSYADVIVGANTGSAAYVYYGSNSGVSASGNATLSGSGNFGHAVGTAGDVNGDGYSDVIAGAPYYDNGETDEGRAFVYYGGIRNISLGATTIVPGSASGQQLGWKVRTAGDVNGDGYSDVMVSTISNGTVYVCYGSATGISTTPSWTASGGSTFGWAMGTAGDVNGDGYSDIIIGRYSSNTAYVYHGSSSGLPSFSSPSWTVTGSGVFGYGAGTAGDVNGDGYSDVIIASRDLKTDIDPGNSNIANYGAAYIFHGSPNGLSNGAAITTTASANTTIYGPRQSRIDAYNDPGYSAYFGLPSGCAGDVNGDGFDDVFIGAERYEDDETNGPLDEGAAYVYYGSQSGVQTTGYWITHPTNRAYNYYGIGLGCAGDVNGDGYADVVVGAYRYPNNATESGNKNGKLYLFLGSSAGLSTTPEIWSPEGEDIWSFLGYDVGTAGDLNGDGYSDIIAGARQYGISNGAVYIYYGSASGPSPTYSVRIVGTGTKLGWSVGMAGDVNGDGYADALAGTIEANSNTGALYVFYGNSTQNGLTVQPRQHRPDFSRDIIPALKTRSVSNVGLRVNARSIQGRVPMKAQFEVKRRGTAFDGTGLTETGFTNTSGSGTLHQTVVSGLASRRLYKWRARLVYNPAQAAGLQHSRWFYPALSLGPTLAAFQVSNDDISLPVELTSFTGSLTGTGVRLNWTTETETDNLGFVLLRNGSQIASYRTNMQLKGQGTTASQTRYSFFDAGIEIGKEYTYRLKSVDLNGTVHEFDREVRIGNPDKYELDQNYPNPFNPTTTIRFAMKQAGKARLTVYDVLGRAVKSEAIEAVKGWNQYEFDGSRLSSGVYFYRLAAGEFSTTKKMMLVK